MAKPTPKFAAKDEVKIKFSDRTDFGTVKSRRWNADAQEWEYHVRRPAHTAISSGELVVVKGDTTGWAGLREAQLSKA
jgi:hypothetical protein